jgi:hypothetical protein
MTNTLVHGICKVLKTKVNALLEVLQQLVGFDMNPLFWPKSLMVEVHRQLEILQVAIGANGKSIKSRPYL